MPRYGMTARNAQQNKILVPYLLYQETRPSFVVVRREITSGKTHGADFGRKTEISGELSVFDWF